jgi:hypothetical protein
MAQRDSDASGCGVLIAGVLVIGAVVAAVISIAALVDPFSWLPSIAQVWSDCDGGSTSTGCDLEDRYPGFWGHAIVNFIYVVAAVIVLGGLAAAVADLREARQALFSDSASRERYMEARQVFGAAAALVAVLALVPIIVAVA